jgi:hypothetical protein
VSCRRPRQDSNLRSRLRRAVLYPLSYGGRAWAEEKCTSAPRIYPRSVRRQIAASIVGLIVGLILCATGCVRPAPPGPAEIRETPPPWPAPADAVSYIRAAGVEPEPYTSYDNPRRVQLRVFVDGTEVTVPAWVGIDRPRALQGPAHTHDDSGTISLEGRGSEEFTLGQFFTEWGVRLSDSCLGATCGKIKLLVDGQSYAGDARAIRLSTVKTIFLAASSA